MRNADTAHFVGIDTGGTFTDFIYVGPSGITSCKILSSPEAPEKAIFRGLKTLGLEASLGRVMYQLFTAPRSQLTRLSNIKALEPLYHQPGIR